MGADIYLSWEGQTEEEIQKQIKELFSINAGLVGYLRANIGMVEETELLKEILSNDVWISGDPEEVDFEAEKERAFTLLKEYLRGEKETEEMDDGDKTTEATKKVWATSLVEFWKMGLNLQGQGKNPKVLVNK